MQLNLNLTNSQKFHAAHTMVESWFRADPSLAEGGTWPTGEGRLTYSDYFGLALAEIEAMATERLPARPMKSHLRQGTWRKLESGDWGARVVGGEAPRAGEVIAMRCRARGGRKYLSRFVVTRVLGPRRVHSGTTYHLCRVVRPDAWGQDLASKAVAS